MKSITTLVPDIYKLLSEGTKIKEDNLKEFSSRLETLLRTRLSSGVAKESYLRMSNFGSPCERQLWYKINMADKAEPLDPWTLHKFLYGDILELLFLFLAKEADHTVDGVQDEMELYGLKGSRDAVIDGVLVDVKSASSRAMGKFREHRLEEDDPFGYIDQLSLYLEASKNDDKVAVKGEAAFAAVDKELGHLVLDTYRLKKTTRDWEKEISAKRAMLAEKNPPNRAYKEVPDGKSGNMKIPMQCSYCQFKDECWKNANGGAGLRKFIYSSGPVWLTNVAREPRVHEPISEK